MSGQEWAIFGNLLASLLIGLTNGIFSLFHRKPKQMEEVSEEEVVV